MAAENSGIFISTGAVFTQICIWSVFQLQWRCTRAHTPWQTLRDTNWHTHTTLATCNCTHPHTHNIHTVKVMKQAAAFQQCVKSSTAVNKLHRHSVYTPTHTTYHYAFNKLPEYTYCTWVILSTGVTTHIHINSHTVYIQLESRLLCSHVHVHHDTEWPENRDPCAL